MESWIEPERPGDEDPIREVTIRAFTNHPFSRGQEPGLIDALRRSGALTLSLVARIDNGVVGHVAASPVKVGEATEGWFGLGPLSVQPEFQKRGIGSALMREALGKLRERGAKGCVLVGPFEYYKRFGFRADPAFSVYGVPAVVTLSLRFIDSPDCGPIEYHAAFGEGTG